MGFDLLMTFPLMNGVEAFPRGKVQRVKEGTPRILVTWRFYFHLFTYSRVGLSIIGTPVQIGTVKVNQLGRFRWLSLVCLRSIMTG